MWSDLSADQRREAGSLRAFASGLRDAGETIGQVSDSDLFDLWIHFDADTQALVGSLNDLRAAVNGVSAEHATGEAEARAAQTRAPVRTGPSTARTVAAGVSGGLDSPMDLILPQIPYEADLDRSGRYREFTYRFEDGSRLVLTAVPAGGQTGLVLYSVDIQE